MVLRFSTACFILKVVCIRLMIHVKTHTENSAALSAVSRILKTVFQYCYITLNILKIGIEYSGMQNHVFDRE